MYHNISGRKTFRQAAFGEVFTPLKYGFFVPEPRFLPEKTNFGDPQPVITTRRAAFPVVTTNLGGVSGTGDF